MAAATDNSGDALPGRARHPTEPRGAHDLADAATCSAGGFTPPKSSSPVKWRSVRATAHGLPR